MPKFDLNLFGLPASSGFLLVLMAVYTLVWAWNLATIMRRTDFDPITRLTWVVVVIFAPLIGLFIYWFQVPEWNPTSLSSENPPSGGPGFPPGGTDPKSPNSLPVPDVRGTPWEGNPGHQL